MLIFFLCSFCFCHCCVVTNGPAMSKAKNANKLVSVPYSCMDTSSKTWLPHQSQFGLVGQAEVCCGGSGVLTPSESVLAPKLVNVSPLSAVPPAVSQPLLQSVVVQ